MEKEVESAVKTGEIKFVIKSIIPITSDFAAVIKNSNDTSNDNLLEFRSLMSNSFKVDGNTCNDGNDKTDKSYSDDVKQFIKKVLEREKPEASANSCDDVKNDSGVKSEQNDSSESMSDLVITKKQKIKCSDGSPAVFATMASSTPIKVCEHHRVKLDISGVGFLSFDDDDGKNKNVSLNDSDFESMDQDQYDESQKIVDISDDDPTLINIQTTKSDENKTSGKENNTSIISRTSSLTDFKNGLKLIIEETVKRTPMALKKVFNMDSDSGSTTSSLKKSNFLNIFSSTKKLKRKQSPGKKRHNRRSSSCKKKHSLTKENLQKYLNDDENDDKENIKWGDNFDYSFICEPASSDVDENENSPNYISYNTSLDSSIEMMKSPLIPSFKIDPPPDGLSSVSSMTSQNDLYPPACDYVRHTIKCSYASKLSLSTSLRRSNSAPVFEDNFVGDEDSTEFAYSHANTTKTCEASIKNLTQLSVSIFLTQSIVRFASRLTFGSPCLHSLTEE